MATCAAKGGCPSDYIAISVAVASLILLLGKSLSPYLIHKIPRPRGSSFWLMAIQVFASFNLLVAILMSLHFLKFGKRKRWTSCYLWAVWVEGPLGFGLLLCCRIAQAFHLYFVFVKRRLPPIRSYIFLPMILIPWIACGYFLHKEKPLNNHCHMRIQWIIPVISLHALYVATVIGFTGAVRHIKFRFEELKALWRGILVSTASLGIWVVSYILNEIYEEIAWLQVASRFVIMVMASVLVLLFFTFSISQPLVSLMSLAKKDEREYQTMGQALGVVDSGLLYQRELSWDFNSNEPLDKLLLNKRFRESFTEFADSCLAGESVHFYEELQQFDKIPIDDTVGRIYMARHIIEKYIVAGAPLEVNISHHCRQGILTTTDLAHPQLFHSALGELMHLMKLTLARDYWASPFFQKLKDEASMRTVHHDTEDSGWNFSPRLSSVHCAENPFQHEHSPVNSAGKHRDLGSE
ncbi:unnamed protein product [Cuscuta europaea]|uniref:RGS domain-containing protein n=2 Tax=Cuscuta europaea TaxID=41803 RepID=A0A9P0ZYH0_CUSEU|nr:unnamed protein product [Cuscuta europaea]